MSSSSARAARVRPRGCCSPGPEPACSIVDRGAYGTDTLSTHALMRGAVLQLHRWGVLPAVVAAGTPAVSSTTFDYEHETVAVAIEPKYGVEALYAPRRLLLDGLLSAAAVESGAEVAYGVRVDDVVRDETGRVRGVMVTAPGGQPPHRRRPGDRRRRLVFHRRAMRRRRAPRRGAARQRVALHLLAGAAQRRLLLDVPARRFVGAIPTNDGATCVVVSIAARPLPRRGARRRGVGLPPPPARRLAGVCRAARRWRAPDGTRPRLRRVPWLHQARGRPGLGTRGRRRLLQGSDDRARHHRRPA